MVAVGQRHWDYPQILGLIIFVFLSLCTGWDYVESVSHCVNTEYFIRFRQLSPTEHA